MKKTTFIFLLFNTNGKEGNERKFNGELETQLLRSRYNGNINILIVYTDVFDLPQSTFSTFGTHLIELVKGAEAKENWSPKTVANFGNVNIGSQDTLGLIFTFIKGFYKTENYIVYSNSHSNQFGALERDINPITNSRANFKARLDFNITEIAAEEMVQTPPPFTRFNYKVEVKPNIDMLTYNEFSKAMINSFVNNLNEEGSSGKVALLVLVSCYSATIDNIVNFQEAVDYLCVSEGEIFYNFVNLKEFVETFSDLTADNTGGKLISFFGRIDADYPEQNSAVRIRNIGLTEFRCFDLRDSDRIKLLTEYINRFVLDALSDIELLQKIKQKGYTKKNDIAYIFRPTEKNTFPPYSSVDFEGFLDSVADITDPRLTSLINRFKTLINEITLASYNNGFKGPRCGLSLFVPDRGVQELNKNLYEYVSATYSVYSTQANEFSKKTLWPELLQAIEKISIYKAPR